MKRLLQAALLGLAVVLTAPSALAGGLGGVWTLEISQYQNTCGGKPTAAKQLTLTQKGRELTAAIGVLGEDGKTYTGTFHGRLENDSPPTKASLYGKFEVGGFTTEETIQIQFLSAKNYTGASQWKTQSADQKITCLGTQKIKGSKK